jgi:hypothetical protein
MDCEQPAVEPGSWNELISALNRALARRAHELFGYVAPTRQYKPIAPKARQARIKSRPYFASAFFAHGL